MTDPAKVARGKAANNRGKDTERKVAGQLRLDGFPHAERTVRTGYRTANRELRDAGDIDGTPGVVWQVKATLSDAQVPRAMAETELQRAAGNAVVGVLVGRRPGHLPGRWWAYVPAAKLLALSDGASLALSEFGGTVGPLAPVRLELSDLTAMLRSWGLGEPLPNRSTTLEEHP